MLDFPGGIFGDSGEQATRYYLMRYAATGYENLSVVIGGKHPFPY